MTHARLRSLCDQALQLSLLALLVVVPLVFYTSTHDVFEINKITAFRIFTLLGLLAFLTRTLLAGGFTLRLTALWPPVAAVGLTSLLSTVWTNNLGTSLFGVYEDFEGILTIANYILLWFLVTQHVRRFGQVQKFLTAVLLAGTVAAGYGVAQNFGFDFVPWNPTTYTANRMFGTLGNPNFLAAYVLMAIPLAAVRFWVSPRRSGKLFYLLMVLLMLGCLFFTKSRGALVALAVEVLLLAGYLVADSLRAGRLWADNRRWLLVLALLGSMTLAAPQVRGTIQTTVHRAVALLNFHEVKLTPRLYIWRSALQMIRDHPLVGSGLDTFQITFPKYRLAEYWRLEWNGTPEKAHNFLLQIGATTGLLGLGAWLWLLTAYFLLLGRQLRTLPAPRRHVAVGIGVAQAGFLVQDLFSFTVVAYGSLFWFFLALGPVLYREEAEPASGREGEAFALSRLRLADWMVYVGATGLVFLALIFSLRLWAADVYFKRGIIFLSQGMPDRAIPFLGKATALNPQREIYWVKYGIAYEEAAKRAQDKEPLLRQAAEIHQHTIGMNPLNGYDFNNLGRVYKYWGDYLDPARLAKAEEACQKAAQLDPYNVYFALDLASVYLAQKRFGEADRIAERLSSVFPDFAIPYAYQGYVRLVQGNQEEALRFLDLAAKKDWRGDVDTHASTWSNLGIVLARRGELEAAGEAFQHALDLRSQYLEARLNRALVLERQGRNAEALSEYRRILNEAPNFPQAEKVRQKIQLLERSGSS